MALFIEINIADGRKTRIRSDRITELRDDFVGAGKGKERRPICRIIMDNGANVAAEGETVADFWSRMERALGVNVAFVAAPATEQVAPDDGSLETNDL